MYPAIPTCGLHRSFFLIPALLFFGKLWCQPVADFRATSTSGCAPLLVNFRDLSTGTPTSWKWDLGNGTTSFLQYPSATYFSPGKYKITLIALNDRGADSIVKDEYITVFPAPTVNFNSDLTSGCLPLPVQFNDESLAGNGTIENWKWDFGDGYIDSIQNPKHIYTLSGPHDVTLQVINSFGCIGSASKAKYVDIPPTVKANFSSSLENLCRQPVIIDFKNLSSGPSSLTYQWNFGDSTTSSLINPSHQYSTAGSYIVQLITYSDKGCRDTIEKTIVGKVKADFINPVTLCRSKAFTFTNTSNPVPETILWKFGDGTNSTFFEPAKTYAIPGDYIVTLVADFGECRDSVSQTITVLPKQDINFIADDTGSCKAPFTVNFISNNPGLSSYNWTFGDGTTSTEINPSHTYIKTGIFDVTLTAGCGDIIKMPKLIKIKPTTVTLPDLPVENCVPFTYTFKPKIISADSIISYQWDFGDGITSTTATPTHTFSTVGNYTISLTITNITGCTASIKKIDGIIVGNHPTANFSASPRVTCAKEFIHFNDLSTGDVDKWEWDFGDGDTAMSQNPIHRYKDSGFFTVTLVAKSNGCPDTISFSNYIYTKAPIAKFLLAKDCTNPLSKSFTDISIGADSWEWNFGDGNNSTLKDPTHIYSDTGTYTVSLKVKNILTGCDYSTEKKIQVINPMTNFKANDTSICKASTPVFEIQSSNTKQIVSYTWNFGDGTIKSYKADSVPAELKFTHRYLKLGYFDVRLTTKDSLGCNDTILKPYYMNVSVPTVKFTTNASGVCLNTLTHFIDSTVTNSSHKIIKWIWTYGDSTIESLNTPPFQHLYKQPGNYTVKLKVIEDNGCTDSLTRSNYITISKPIAGFFTNDTISCTSGLIKFRDSSRGTNLKYRWNFGDGSISDSSNAVHKYSAQGNFSVALKITDQFGCADSINKPNYISIKNPVSDFIMSDSVSTCPPFFVTFTNFSSNDSSILWDFGDGNISTGRDPIHSYYLPGTYTVKLRVAGYGGCTAEKTRRITIKGPQGTFTYTNLKGCNPLQSAFKASTINSISFTWDFNDGNIVSTKDSTITHKYINSGIYYPKMILTDESGCQVPIKGIDSIFVAGINADFNNSAISVCDSASISFRDSSISNDIITSYLWKFGDGTTSSEQNPVHSFKKSGNYITRLFVTSQYGCKDSSFESVAVKIINSPKVAIISLDEACSPATINMSGKLLGGDTSFLVWKWNFGNGISSSQRNPSPQVYSDAGNYIVQSIAINNSGCSDTASKTIVIYAQPKISTNEDSWVCKGKPVSLSVTGAENYSWTPTTGLSCANCATPVALPDNTILYIVKGTSEKGCVGSDSVLISVQRPFNISVSDATSLCRGAAVLLKASGTDNFEWTPTTGLDDPTSATTLARPEVSTNYRVIGSDEHGCFKDTGYVAITVSPVPIVEAGNDKTINVGQTIDLIPEISDDVTDVNWSPTSGIFRNNFPGIAVKPVESTEYTVEVSNSGGCKARDKVTVYVICNNTNVFVPNAFSPNGDGINDIFYPRGSGVFKIKLLKIFDRWGETVFEKANINSNEAITGWDGTFKNRKLPPDVYIYILNIVCDNNSTLTFKGNVALIK